MEVESHAQPSSNNNKEEPMSTMSRACRGLRKAMVIINYTIMVLGAALSPLLLRLYFIYGGKRKWLSSWLQTGGCPLILFPLSLSYAARRHRNITLRQPTRPFLITPRLFLASTILGLLTGVDDFLYAYGMSYLPVSTSAILISTQLGFTAFFAFLLVKQRFTPFSVNAIALLSFGAVILGMDASKDRPKGETKVQYYMGFFMILGAALLYGVVLPLVELTYAKAKQAVTYTLVMEMQLVMGFFATAFCTVGMWINKDFQAIPRDAKEFGLGETKYWMVLVCSAVLWQFFFLGTVGAIFYGSALLAGVIMAVLIPVTEVLAVIFFHEPFGGGKGISLALSLWGFTSYFYGEYKANNRRKSIVLAQPRLVNPQN